MLAGVCTLCVHAAGHLQSNTVALHQLLLSFVRLPKPSSATAGGAVTAGDQAFLTPRRLTVVNTSSGSRIRDLSFSSSVLSVRLNRQR